MDYNNLPKDKFVFAKRDGKIADKKLDVTQDVINGLNKRYKPSAKPAADTKKDEAKTEEKK